MKLSVRNDIIIIFFIFILGFCIRFIPFYNILSRVPSPIQTPDAHYHTRRVINTIQHYPHLPVYDAYLSYPTGGYCIWPPAFDFICATIIYGVFLGHPTVSQIEWGCALYPIFYGLIIIFMVYYLAKKLIDRRTALLSSVIIAVLPVSVLWSRLGYHDHHIAEALILLIITYFLTRVREQDAISIVGLGITMGLGLLMWQGVILFAGLIFVILVVRRHFRLFWSFGIALLMILPFSIQTHFPDSPFSYRGLSMLHIILLLSAFLILLILHGIRQKSRLSILFGLIFIGLITFIIFTPSFLKGFAFIFKRDPWLANILEFQPLMIHSGYWETTMANMLYGRAYYVWPVLTALIYIEKRQPRVAVLCIITILTGLMAFMGRRYTVWFGPLYALILAYGFCRIWDLLSNYKKFFIKYPAMILLTVIVFQPVIKYFPTIRTLSPQFDELAVYAWIREHTPVTSYYDKPTKKPEYGIMCFWGDGHYLLYYTHRPVSASNFGNDVPNFDLVNRFYLSLTEGEADALLDSLHCRYIYTSSWQYHMRFAALYLNRQSSEYFNYYPTRDQRGVISSIMMPTEKGYATTISRLQYYLGNSFYINNKYYAPYRHYRLLYVDRENKSLKFYQYVPGAVIMTHARPSASGIIELKINVMGESFIYRDSLLADKNGLWMTTVPYPTDSILPYNLMIDGFIKNIVVPESAILKQDTIRI